MTLNPRLSTKRIGILTGGDDCPGLNAVIRAACVQKIYMVTPYLDLRMEMKVFSPDYFELDVSGIIKVGTILGATNFGHFSLPLDQAVIDTSISNYHKLGLECLICVGGEGSMAISYELSKFINVIGVPKTIDNDLSSTDQSFGYDSAVSIATEAIDRIHTTASSHHRVMVVEVMGRNAGWLALASGVSSGAHVILIPEIKWNWKSLFSYIRQRHMLHRAYTIIVVAEGIKFEEKDIDDNETLKKYGFSVGIVIRNEIEEILNIEARCTVLGHIQRGGSPSSFDRILATKFGVKAAQLACEGKSGYMVSLRNTKIEAIELSSSLQIQKLVSPDDELVQTARLMGISFGDA